MDENSRRGKGKELTCSKFLLHLHENVFMKPIAMHDEFMPIKSKVYASLLMLLKSKDCSIDSN